MRKRTRVILATLGAGAVVALIWLLNLNAHDPGLRNLRSVGRVEDIVKASQDYFRLHAKWPVSLQAMMAEARWADLATNDAWGHEILYIPYDAGRGCGIAVTLGADKRPGGVGRNADGFGCFGGSGEPPALADLRTWTRDAFANGRPQNGVQRE